MEWPLRFIGIALIVALFGISVGRVLNLDFENSDTRAGESSSTEVADVIDAAPSSDDLASVPEYVAYVPVFSPGSYEVLDDPDSDDWDYRLRRGVDHDIPEPDGELMPGLYASSFDGTECGYELHRVLRTQRERMIGSDELLQGRLLATINEIEPDRFVSYEGCGEWIEWSPLVEPLRVATNGDYWIGDLELGTWLVPDGCQFEEVVNFRGAQVHDVLRSGIGPMTIDITDESMGFRIRNCRTGIVHESAAADREIYMTEENRELTEEEVETGQTAAAAVLGAGPWFRTRHLTWPLVRPAVSAGWLLSFAFALHSFEAPFLLGSSRPRMLSVLAAELFRDPTPQRRSAAAAVGLVVAVIALAAGGLAALINRSTRSAEAAS